MAEYIMMKIQWRRYPDSCVGGAHEFCQSEHEWSCCITWRLRAGGQTFSKHVCHGEAFSLVSIISFGRGVCGSKDNTLPGWDSSGTFGRAWLSRNTLVLGSIHGRERNDPTNLSIACESTNILALLASIPGLLISTVTMPLSRLSHLIGTMTSAQRPRIPLEFLIIYLLTDSPNTTQETLLSLPRPRIQRK